MLFVIEDKATGLKFEPDEDDAETEKERHIHAIAESLQKADRVMPEEVANRLAESALDAASQVNQAATNVMRDTLGPAVRGGGGGSASQAPPESLTLALYVVPRKTQVCVYLKTHTHTF